MAEKEAEITVGDIVDILGLMGDEPKSKKRMMKNVKWNGKDYFAEIMMQAIEDGYAEIVSFGGVKERKYKITDKGKQFRYISTYNLLL